LLLAPPATGARYRRAGPSHGQAKRQGTQLVSFAFAEILAEDVDRIHNAIFDSVLLQFGVA